MCVCVSRACFHIVRVFLCVFTQRFQRSVKNLRDVLGVCVKSSPALLGSTVWGRQELHRVLKTTALQQKIKPTPLYFVKVCVYVCLCVCVCVCVCVCAHTTQDTALTYIHRRS